jgi:hypothetical protein
MFFASKAEGRPRPECSADSARPVCRALDQIGAGAEQVLSQDRVADHHRVVVARQIHPDHAPAVPPVQSRKHCVVRHQKYDGLDGLWYPRTRR